MCLPDFFILLPLRSPGACYSLGFHDFQTHVARRTHDRAHRGIQIGGVEIDKLDLGDFFDLLLRYLPDLVAIRLGRTLGNARGAQQKNGGRRGLENEGEGTIGIDRNQHRENHAVGFLLGLGVELLAEIHNVHAMGTERRTHRRSRSGLAGRQLQLDGCLYLLWWHLSFTSISVARPLRGEAFIPAFPRSRNPVRLEWSGRKSSRKLSDGCDRYR